MVSIALCRTAVPIKGGKGWHVPFWTFSDAVIGDGRARWITLTSLSGQRDHIHVSISIGEASVRTKATDPERRKTPRVRTALPGLRVEPKWLPGQTGYAVQCRNFVERDAFDRSVTRSGFATV